MNKNINGFCPHCKADLDGEYVFKTYLEQGRTYPEALRYSESHEGYKEHGVLNRWGRQIGLSDYNLDRVTEWKCPDCEKTWPRLKINGN